MKKSTLRSMLRRLLPRMSGRGGGDFARENPVEGRGRRSILLETARAGERPLHIDEAFQSLLLKR